MRGKPSEELLHWFIKQANTTIKKTLYLDNSLEPVFLLFLFLNLCLPRSYD